MKIVAFLPVKGHSQRIENKNLKLLDGKPLFIHTLDKLVNSNFFDEVYLDTESEEIIDAASEIDCKILKRDPSLASNKTNGNKLFENQIAQVDADIYVQILATSPFILIETIKNAINNITESNSYDSAVLVSKQKQYTWKNNKPEYNHFDIPNSIDLEDVIIETMGLYIVKKDVAHKNKRRLGDNPLLIESTPIEAIDVNFPEDFHLAELIAAGRRESDRKLLANYKINFNSSLLSDILDELGYKNQVIKGLSSNLPGTKMLGRAKTLKIAELKENEDFRGIYKALESYDSIVPGDIIVIQNDVPEYAYFGELNANLSIREGASGVIINGKTRDSSAVSSLNFPVFSTGTTCQDVKNRATTESVNKKIELEGVSVSPNALLFADDEGVIVIPEEIESKVIEGVLKKNLSEKEILLNIAMGRDIDSIIDQFGTF